MMRVVSQTSQSTLVLFQILCGNKSDLEAERVVSREDGEKAAQKLGIPFIETSAKTGSNVEQAFHELVRQVPRSGIEYKVRATTDCAVTEVLKVLSSVFCSLTNLCTSYFYATDTCRLTVQNLLMRTKVTVP